MWIKIFFLAFFSVIDFGQCNQQLQYVQMLWRHGDRAPITLYPTDPNPASSWPEGLEYLTLLGKKQHYTLGKFFKETYKDFITTDPIEVNVLSSGIDRCLKSAAANLASFYKPDTKWKFEGDVNWQPISVYYSPIKHDKYLETNSYCPEAFKEEKRLLESETGQAFLKKHSTMFRDLTKFSGMNISNWIIANRLYDTLYIEKKYNLTIPTWADKYWEELEYVADMSFILSFNSTLMLRLRAGPLIGLVIDNMRHKMESKMPNAKVQIFSSHDTNIAVVLQALGLYDMTSVPYCATLVFELHKLNEMYAVRLRYQNSSAPESEKPQLHTLILNGCTEYCPFEYFVNYTKKFIPGDWNAECKVNADIPQAITDANILTVLFFTIISILIILVGSFTYYKLRNQRQTEYSYHLVS